MRNVLDSVKRDGMFAGRALLFIDEIHRFSKSQQDSLLGAVEAGTVTLLGATTENPSFEVIPALRSRCQTYVLEPLSAEVLQGLMARALSEDADMAAKAVKLEETEALLRASGGDARRLLNTLELVVDSLAPNADGHRVDTNAKVLETIQNTPSNYDKGGEQHYDVVSAFIKSIRPATPMRPCITWPAWWKGRGSQVHRATPLDFGFEDIGNANPTALVLANNTFAAVERIGWPEARIVLSQCAVYLATSPKSNASYKAIGQAQHWIQTHGEAAVPLALRNAPTKLMKDLGYGKGYAYDHEASGQFSGQECLPEGMEGTVFYEPGNNPREQATREWLRQLWKTKYGY